MSNNPVGGGSNRTKEKRECDLKRIAQLRFAGKLQSEIAEELGLSQPIISRDLKELRRRWMKESAKTVDAMIGEEIANYMKLQSIYVQDYQRSVTPIKDDEGRVVGFLPGDPRYLQGVERCIDKRCELLAIKPPAKIAPTTPDGKQQYSGVLVVPALQSVDEWLGESESEGEGKQE